MVPYRENKDYPKYMGNGKLGNTNYTWKDAKFKLWIDMNNENMKKDKILRLRKTENLEYLKI